MSISQRYVKINNSISFDICGELDFAFNKEESSLNNKL